MKVLIDAKYKELNSIGRYLGATLYDGDIPFYNLVHKTKPDVIITAISADKQIRHYCDNHQIPILVLGGHWKHELPCSPGMVNAILYNSQEPDFFNNHEAFEFSPFGDPDQFNLLDTTYLGESDVIISTNYAVNLAPLIDFFSKTPHTIKIVGNRYAPSIYTAGVCDNNDLFSLCSNSKLVITNDKFEAISLILNDIFAVSVSELNQLDDDIISNDKKRRRLISQLKTKYEHCTAQNIALTIQEKLTKYLSFGV